MIPIVGALLSTLAENGLGLLSSAIQAKGKEVVEKTLGVKIADMANYKADPLWPILTPKFISATGHPELEFWITPRINNMERALEGGINEWANFNCLGNAFTFKNSNLILRKGLARFGEIGILRDLDSGCSTEEVVKTFYKKLDSYATASLW